MDGHDPKCATFRALPLHCAFAMILPIKKQKRSEKGHEKTRLQQNRRAEKELTRNRLNHNPNNPNHHRYRNTNYRNRHHRYQTNTSYPSHSYRTSLRNQNYTQQPRLRTEAPKPQCRQSPRSTPSTNATKCDHPQTPSYATRHHRHISHAIHQRTNVEDRQLQNAQSHTTYPMG